MKNKKYILSFLVIFVFILWPFKVEALTDLVDLSVEGATLSPVFRSDNYMYDVIMSTDTMETKINFELVDNRALVINAGKVTLKEGKEHIISIIDEEGNLSVYKLLPRKVVKSLKTLEFEGVSFEFRENVLDYSFIVPFWVSSLDVKNIDKNYSYTFSDSFLRIGEQNVTMVAKKDGVPDIEYTFHVIRSDFPGASFQYNAKGSGYETFIVPKTGRYKIELWGAQGGSYGGNYGGKGSYTSGEIELQANEKLYFYVGNSSETRIGGYNGGANGGTQTSDGNERGGGGATDVRLVPGEWNDFESLKSRIMVAAGGGGAIYYQATYVYGGAGGGLNGYGASLKGYTHPLAVGATQTSGGTPGGYTDCSQGAKGSFGFGGEGGHIRTSGSGTYGGGGGGGYYGGAGGGCVGGGVSSGSSGSSYISGHNGSNSILQTSTSSAITHTGSATHYSNKVFQNTKMIDGAGKAWTTAAGAVTNMPSWDGTTTIAGNSGNGYAKIYLMEHVEPVLTDLQVTGGILEESFSPDNFSYTMFLTDEEVEVELLGINSDYDLKIEGNGKYIVKPGDSKLEIKVTNPHNESNTYVINIKREYSSAPILKGILVNGLEIPDFEAEVLEYTVEVLDIYPFVVVDGIVAYPGQEVTGGGVKVFGDASRLDVSLLVRSEDTNLDYEYKVHIVKKETTKLKSLVLNGDASMLKFQPNILEYEIKLLPNVMSLDVEAIPASLGAQVKVEGNSYISSSKDSVITVTVTKDGLEPTVYEIKIIRNTDLSEHDHDYPYDSGVPYYEFIAPVSGYYNIEAWGAQGGSFDGLYGGEGAYTKGEILLAQGEKLYIYVGSTTEDRNAGYNSGASGGTKTNDGIERGGGGATDIRLVSGSWNNFDSLKSRIMVAAGGGGSILYQSVKVYGGAGGGLNGYGGALKGVNHTLATGATQTAGGAPGGVTYCSQGARGSFGAGGSGGVIRTDGQSGTYGGGGGGGYFGGGGGGCIGSGVSSGASGSSFISGHLGSNALDETSMANNLVFTNQEIHYSGKKFINTLMIDGKGYDWTSTRGSLTMMPDKNNGHYQSGHGNSGDGLVKIKLLSLVSSDNYLDQLVVSKGVLSPEFETGVFEYNLNLGETDAKLEIGAIPKDKNATVTGIGVFDIKPGDKDYVVSVTATDGSVRNYTIHVHRDGSSDASPLNIKLNKLSSYLCKKNEAYCNYTFDGEILNYEIIVPFVTEEIELRAYPRSVYQEITYYKYDGDDYVETESGLYTLDSGENKFKIKVVAEDGVTINEYLYSITRDDAGNANLKSLAIQNPDMEVLDFSKNVYEYYLNIEGSYTSYEVVAVPESPDASVTSIKGNTDLRIGMNDCFITVTSKNGTTKTYVIHMYKEQDTNVFLRDLQIKDKDNNILEIAPEFNKLLNNYTLTVSNEIGEVTVLTEAESLDASVTGNGKIALVPGVNNVKVTVTAGEYKNEYEIVIYRKKNSNANLSNIEVDGFRLVPDFDKNETEYYLTVDKDTKDLKVTATPEVETTTYTVKGNVITSDSQDIVVTSVAEDKSYKVYTIHVSRDVDDDKTLKNILLPEGISLNEEFRPTQNNYTITVDDSVSSLEITGVANSNKAVVKGNGVYSLMTGNNTIELVVTSEKGEENTYTIVVNRLKSNDSTLKMVINNQGSEVVKSDETNYLINVQYEINSIEITGVPNSSKAVVSGNGYYKLNVGEENIITLRVTAEDNTYTDYKVKVVRDKSQNDDLAFLYVHEGALQPNFRETTIVYDVYVPEEIDDFSKVHIEAVPEDKNATYEILDNTGALEIGVSKAFIIRVTAQDGVNTKDYKVNVIRQKVTTENLALEILETNRGDVVPTFSSDRLNYTLEVSNDVKDITVTARAFSSDVKVEGNGTYNLKVGKNLISILVRGTDGVEKDYQIVVTRKRSSDATLASLIVKGRSLIPAFNKDIDKYGLTVSGTELEFTTISPSETDATYQIGKLEGGVFEPLNEIRLNTIDISSFPASQDIVIRVTAPDEVTTKDYTLALTKSPSKNNNLASLEVEGYTLVPDFHKGINVYTLDVPNGVKSVIINARPEDENAIVTGIGLKKIFVGSNQFEIVVESEAGTMKKYTIIIAKDGSDNNNLASLMVSAGVLSPEFKPNILEYSVDVLNDVASIRVTGTLEDINASTSDFGDYNLDVGRNEIEICVTSESGNIKIYKIIVNRRDLISADLVSLDVQDYELDSEFDALLTEYYINVNNEIDSLDKLVIEAIPRDSEARVDITSENENFSVGMNEVKILVTARDMVTTKEYILYVNRSLSTNNYLRELYVSEGSLSPEFDPEVLEYNVRVGNEIATINIDAKTQDSSSKIVSGIGDFNLVVGNNRFQIKVKSAIGIYRTYILNVEREKSIDNYLTNLFVKKDGVDLTFNEPFNKEDNYYTLTVPSDVSYVTIVATASSNLARVTGLGYKSLVKGDNTFVVTVTSEAGEANLYTIVITKEASSNNKVLDIIPSAGEFSDDFDPEVKEYILNVDESVVSIGFEVVLEDTKAIVRGNEVKAVSDDALVRTIVVEAEDGTENTYVINIVKASAAEARLESLEILGYPIEFDANTFTYNIRVSESKKKLLLSEITAVPKDSEATVNMMGDLVLSQEGVNVYSIQVIAKDGYTTEEYTLNITRDSEEYSLRSNLYEIVRFDSETEEDYVIGIQPSTIITEFKNNFENDVSMLHVYRDTTEVSETDLTATTLILKLEKDGYVYDTLRVIVRGDLTSDGKVNITDQVKIINYVGRTVTFNKYEMLAGDLTFDGKVNITDQVKLINYVGRTVSDLNKKPTN